MTARPPKVLLVGWDAADWRVIDPLLDAGEMPALQRLVENGVIGNLATLLPSLSPMLWTSIATGKRPYKHGIYGFSEPDPYTGRIRPITNLSRKTKAVWNILQQSGKRSNVVGWWPSHPAEPISGVMVSNHYQKSGGALDQPWPIHPGTIHPARLHEPLKQFRIHPCELGEEHLLPFVPQAAEIDQKSDRRLMSLAKIIAECSSIHATATALMQQEPWDFMAVYFDAIDHFCHGFMKYHPPRLPWIAEADFEMYKDVVAGGYRYHDMMLGTLLELAGPDTTVILISDHGFHPDHLRPLHLPNEPAGPAAEHGNYGIFAMMGDGVKRDERVYGATLLDITPTILNLFGLPVGRDMDGRVLAGCFESVPTVEHVDSWDIITGDSGQHPADTRLDPAESQEVLRQLVDLGYIEEPDDNLEKARAETIRELNYNLARSYIHGGQQAEAIDLLESMWDRWPEEQRFGVRLLGCLLTLDRVNQARSILQRIKDQKQQYAGTAKEELKSLMDALIGVEPSDYSEQQQRSLHKLSARSVTSQPAIAYLTALVLHAEGKLDEALEHLRQASAAQTHNKPSVYLKQGEILLDQQKWQEAEVSFQLVLELDPTNSQAHLGLCRSFLGRRKNKLALAEALAAVGLLYNNPQGHYLHGVAMHRLGQIQVAEQALLMAVQQHPNFPSAHERLAYLYQKRLNDPEKAAEHRRLKKEAETRIRDHRAGILNSDVAVVSFNFVDDTQAVLLPTPKLDVPTSEVIAVVSGLPRSGTSMMMNMLARGGMEIFTDGSRQADESNPRGYFEHEKVKQLAKDRGWLDEVQGKAIKVITPLVPYLAPEFHYRIIFMERDLNELLASQEQMLSRLGREGGKITHTSLAENFAKQLAFAKQLVLESPKAAMLIVRFGDVFENPREIAARVSNFLQANLDLDAMVDAVDSSLYREQRKLR